MAPRRQTQTVVQRRSVSIWDNFASHASRLRARGATERELARLRAAAEAVEAAERRADLASTDIATAALPSAVRALGWTIQPPTKEARSWARTAMEAVTGGREPAPGMGQLMALLAALWALREVGDGRAAAVMQTVGTRGALAGVVQGLVDDLRGSEATPEEALASLAEDYARAMGFLLPPPVAGAIARLGQEMERIHGRLIRCVARQMSCSKASARRSSSGFRGSSSGAVSQPQSSMRGLNARPGSRRRGSRT